MEVKDVLRKFDKTIKKDRDRKCKRLRKLRIARDMASRHTKQKLLLSRVYDYFRFNKEDEHLSKRHLAYFILNRAAFIAGVRPPPPKPTSVKK